MDHHEGYDSSNYEQVHENESEESEQEVESTLIAKPKTKSAVWNFFRVESDSDGRPSNTNKPICYKCMEPVAASYGNTSNLFNHLRRKHPLVYAQVYDKKKCKKKAPSLKGSGQQSIEHAFSLSRNMTEMERNGSN